MSIAHAEGAVAPEQAPSPWPGRLALWTLIAAVPLILFGGAVTTMRAGMAENGWLQPDGHLLWLYPWAKRISSAGVFVEHHHRELGTLVGLLSVLTVVTTLIFDGRMRAKAFALLGLLAVTGQGVIGGFRVLENNVQLAFLHGAIGQAVFAILAAVALVLSSKWRTVKHVPWTEDPRLAGLATTAMVLVWLQGAIGGYFRHMGSHAALGVHVLLAVGVLLSVLTLTRRLKEARKRPEVPACAAGVLRRCAIFLTAFLHSQILLGVLAAYSIFALSGGPAGQDIHALELITATGHVIVGASLLAAATVTALWTRGMQVPAGGGAA